ncbi:class I SAM-dependent methyltransferase [Pseudomonas benzenivorans]|uniref:class I SAM-dependent methyltransferase n=1 Tax=Pseudomonas benzenivorans TaxID=556533 RepID=UPI003513D76C
MENRYGTLASWVYDLDKPIGRSFGDIEFYAQRLHDCRGPILEPAVGNGRVLLPLLREGLDVQGFDASEEMLERCRAHARHLGLEPALSCQRFESFAYEQRFAVVIVPAGSFQLVTDFAQARAVLRRFREHLQADGRLIIDLDPCGALIRNEGSTRSWTVSDDEWLTLTEQPLHVDFVDQTRHSYLRYEHWCHGRLASAELERFSLRWWGVAEFELLLRQEGFTDICVFADYQPGQAPKQGCAMISFEARRT